MLQQKPDLMVLMVNTAQTTNRNQNASGPKIWQRITIYNYTIIPGIKKTTKWDWSSTVPVCSVELDAALGLPWLDNGAIRENEERQNVFLYTTKECTDVTVLYKSCSPHLIIRKPFHSLLEFSMFTLVGVYIPHQTGVNDLVSQVL